MKILFLAATLGLAANSFAVDYGYLKTEDQQFYKNDSFEGNNKQERIDSMVKEINKMYGQMDSMKKDIASLKTEVETLKNKK